MKKKKGASPSKKRALLKYQRKPENREKQIQRDRQRDYKKHTNS